METSYCVIPKGVNWSQNRWIRCCKNSYSEVGLCINYLDIFENFYGFWTQVICPSLFTCAFEAGLSACLGQIYTPPRNRDENFSLSKNQGASFFSPLSIVWPNFMMGQRKLGRNARWEFSVELKVFSVTRAQKNISHLVGISSTLDGSWELTKGVKPKKK